jgi:uncharacterized DUF497 family protein
MYILKVRVPRLRFEWDDAKNRINLRKHGIDFSDAASVFDDPNYCLIQDREIAGEERWHAIGIADHIVPLVVVVHTYRDSEDGTETVRLISARRADARERNQYGNDSI